MLLKIINSLRDDKLVGFPHEAVTKGVLFRGRFEEIELMVGKAEEEIGERLAKVLEGLSEKENFKVLATQKQLVRLVKEVTTRADGLLKDYNAMIKLLVLSNLPCGKHQFDYVQKLMESLSLEDSLRDCLSNYESLTISEARLTLLSQASILDPDPI